MRRHVILLWMAFVAGCVGFAQDPSSNPGQNPGSAPPAQSASSSAGQTSGDQHVVAIELNKSLDAKKLKAGDPVKAKTTGILQFSNGMMVPIGSTVQGHITEAVVRSKGVEQSSLGIAFDTVVFKEGQVPVKATIQAVAAPPEWPINNPGNQNGRIGGPPVMSPGSYPGGAGPIGGNPTGPGNPNSGYPPPSSGQPQSPSGQPDTMGSPRLTAQSTGVVGMQNVTLQPNSVLTSSGKDLKLDAGTEMVLRVQDQ